MICKSICIFKVFKTKGVEQGATRLNIETAFISRICTMIAKTENIIEIEHLKKIKILRI